MRDAGSAPTPVRLESLPRFGPSAVVVGVFDGVHRGHQAILAATREAAAARGARPLALVFDPPPAEVLNPLVRVARLAPVGETVARIRDLGLDAVQIVRFDEAMRALSPSAFVELLGGRVVLRAWVMTSGSALGRDRAGTPAVLGELGARRGFEVVTIEPASDGGPVSSTRIRMALRRGSIGLATRFLGGPPLLVGRVVAGEARGQALGYPTANLAFEYEPALPRLGIYAGFANGTPALVSVGVRPTFGDGGPVRVEAHLLDWTGNLYGHELRVELHHRLRDERRFETASALVSQMKVDEREARRRLAPTRAVGSAV